MVPKKEENLIEKVTVPFSFLMMKRTNIAIDEKLIRAGIKATGIKTRRALVDYTLRDLLRRKSPQRILELNDMERKHREGYRRNPITPEEFEDWKTERV